MYIHIYGKLQNFIQLSLNLTLVCHIKCNHPMNFHFSLYRLHCKVWIATKFTHLAIMCGVQCFRHFTNFTQSPKIIPELKSAMPQIWDDFPQTTINKAINDFCKSLNTRISAGDGHFENTFWTLYRNILTELCLLFQKKRDKLCVLTRCLSSNRKNSCCIVKGENSLGGCA